ncbi:competence type IV pilus assembly protein ComGB [Pseudolactococcus paracarnosus]|uniref:Type II secretion system F family protein n=1 Tax=Pseudolactococcus paracarnosus TaxID=2749962 RepID=A0ABT0ALB8_9LACT|nr:competence type IV pilus assembly protein ComGB [Lactococcus paracarnosus]MCJ1977357.1 type II secretion system F family protein [Lactococcus paracarnosus]MCJ1983515.1 type II secretion system F family protein [Lactococcus paracarnosus]MCJ1997847.1 type II secretion system F family protein [Lactococcus paracarnosus]
MLDQDLFVLVRRRSKKLSVKQQVKLLKLIHNLLVSGFHLSEMIHFLDHSKLVDQRFVNTMRTSLANGETISQILARLQFSKSVITQVALADYHGDTQQTFALVTQNLASRLRVRQKMIAVSTYPIILVAALVIMVIGLKTYLLPQVETTNLAGWLLYSLPVLVVAGSISLTLSILFLKRYMKRTSPLKLFQNLARLPVIGMFVKCYLTSFYAREWGNLIKQGLEMRQILVLMQVQDDRLFREIGQDLLAAMQLGRAFHEQIASYRFFTAELSLMIEYGEMKSTLGDELLLYSDASWQVFFDRVDTATNLVQPLIFLFVGLMIVLIYAAMLLPIYAQMELGM